MALLDCRCFSDVLGVNVSFTAILPETTATKIGMVGETVTSPPPVLYLLHGLSDDHTIWQRYTSVERYVDELGLAVIMPAVNRSYYTNEAVGMEYFTFVADELPAKVQSLFRVSDRREDRFVAGLSMGGYGAFKLALTYPERYAAAASLSGALDIAGNPRILGGESDPRMADRLFGPDPIVGTDNDLLTLLDRLPADAADRPALYASCGLQDFLLPDNQVFEAACAAKGVALTMDYRPGDHTWAYWDETIQDVLNWLPLRR